MVELLAQIGEPLDEVLALLFEQQQTGVEPLENGLEATTLLREVADEQALLLEERLELVELALLLLEPVASQVDLGVLLLLALGDDVPRGLERAEVIDGQCETRAS